MKKLLLQFSVLCLLMPLLAPTCRSEEFDPTKTGLVIDFTLNQLNAVVNANPTKATDPEYNKTYSINIKQEVLTRYKIDLSSVSITDVYVDQVTATFNEANCKKLAYYSLSATFPGIGTETKNDCSSATPININKLNPSAFSQKVVTTNFAQPIKDGEAITISFKMKAAQDLDPGVGASVSLHAIIGYKP
jgi:hypothetical protein